VDRPRPAKPLACRPFVSEARLPRPWTIDSRSGGRPPLRRPADRRLHRPPLAGMGGARPLRLKQRCLGDPCRAVSRAPGPRFVSCAGLAEAAASFRFLARLRRRELHQRRLPSVRATGWSSMGWIRTGRSRSSSPAPRDADRHPAQTWCFTSWAARLPRSRPPRIAIPPSWAAYQRALTSGLYESVERNDGRPRARLCPEKPPRVLRRAERGLLRPKTTTSPSPASNCARSDPESFKSHCRGVGPPVSGLVCPPC